MADAGGEDRCAALRWPEGRRCPFCGGRHIWVLNIGVGQRRRYKCGGCRRQFSVFKGTMLEGSKLSADQWLATLAYLCGAQAPATIAGLARHLGIGYGAARYIFDRLDYVARHVPPDSPLANGAIGLAGADGEEVLALLLHMAPPTG